MLYPKHQYEIDLTSVNELQDKYNRYYVLEKEGILDSPQLTKRGFKELPPRTTDDLFEMMPLLPTLDIP